MSEFLDVWVVGLGLAALRFGTPLILAALGGLFSERAGIVNIALEGMMTAGAFFAIFGSLESGHWLGGVVAAVLAGAALGFLHAVATVTFQADQIVSGTAIILVAFGLVNFLNLTIYGSEPTSIDISVPFKIAGISVLTFVTFGLVALTVFLVFRTPFGLRLRSVGEHPRAADTVGIDVYRMRYTAVIISGALAGLGGAFVSFNTSNYSENMIAGNGFIALAALIVGKWRPIPVMVACLVFGLSRGLESRIGGIDALPEALRSPELIAALPYAIALIALAGLVGKSIPPAAIGKPYVKHHH